MLYEELKSRVRRAFGFPVCSAQTVKGIIGEGMTNDRYALKLVDILAEFADQHAPKAVEYVVTYCGFKIFADRGLKEGEMRVSTPSDAFKLIASSGRAALGSPKPIGEFLGFEICTSSAVPKNQIFVCPGDLFNLDSALGTYVQGLDKLTRAEKEKGLREDHIANPHRLSGTRERYTDIGWAKYSGDVSHL